MVLKRCSCMWSRDWNQHRGPLAQVNVEERRQWHAHAPAGGTQSMDVLLQHPPEAVRERCRQGQNVVHLLEVVENQQRAVVLHQEWPPRRVFVPFACRRGSEEGHGRYVGGAPAKKLDPGARGNGPGGHGTTKWGSALRQGYDQPSHLESGVSARVWAHPQRAAGSAFHGKRWPQTSSQAK